MKDVDFFLLLGRRIQTYRSSYAQRKSDHDRQQAAAEGNVRFLQPVLKAEVGFAEDLETLQLWEERLKNVTATREDYEVWFRESCRAREANLGTVASFFAQPLGECNQLYWDLAILIFDPQSLNEMLAILFPSITQTLSFDASCPAGLPPTEDNVTLESVLTQGVAALEDIQQPLQITHLTRLLIAENTLLDLGEIQHFGLVLLAKCIAFLKEHYPQLHRLLSSRNQEFDTALDCVASLSDRGMTLHEALTNFMNDLDAGAVEVTGNELEATPVSEYAPGRFHSFLNALPETRHQEVLRLGASAQAAYKKDLCPLTIGLVLDRLTYGVNEERCVSQAKRYLEKITKNPKNSEALTQSTKLSVEQAAELRRRYFNKPHNVKGLEATFVMPLQFAVKVAAQLTLRTASDITDMMLAAHHTQYALFMSRFQGNIVRAIKALKPQFRDGMFTCEQRFALFNAIARDVRHFLSSSQGEIDPEASPADVLTKFVMPISFIREALDSTPDSDATAFMECFSPLAQLALAGATTAAFGEPEQIDRRRQGAKAQMEIRPSAICRLLAFHPPAVRFELINRQLSDGKADYRNCLDWLLAAAQREVLQAALALFSDEQRLRLLETVPSLVCSRIPDVFKACSQTEKEWLFERSSAALVNWVSTSTNIVNIENLFQSITPAQATKLIKQLGVIPLPRLVELERAFTSTEWLELIQSHVQQYRLGNNNRKQFLTPTLIVCVLKKLNGDQTAAWLATSVTSNTDTIADRIAQSGLATWQALDAAALPNAMALLRKKKPLRRQVVCWDDIVASYDLPEDECFALFDADRDAAQQLVAMLRVERHLLFRKNNMRFWRHMVRERALIGKAQALYYMLSEPRQWGNQRLEANDFALLPEHEQLLNDVQCFDSLLQQYWQLAAEYLLFHTPAQRLELFKKSKFSRVTTPADYLKICEFSGFGIDPMARQDTINQFFAQVRLADAVTWVDIALTGNERHLIQRTISANLHHLLGCAPESVIKGLRASMIKAIRANNLPLLRHYLFYLQILKDDQKLSAQFDNHVADVVLVGKVNRQSHRGICYEFADEMGVLENAVIENNACAEFLLENHIRPDALAQVYALNPMKYFAARQRLCRHLEILLHPVTQESLITRIFEFTPQLCRHLKSDFHTDFLSFTWASAEYGNLSVITTTTPTVAQRAAIDAAYPFDAISSAVRRHGEELYDGHYKEFLEPKVGEPFRVSCIRVFENLVNPRYWPFYAQWKHSGIAQGNLLLQELRASSDDLSEIVPILIRAFIRASLAQSTADKPIKPLEDSFMRRLICSIYVCNSRVSDKKLLSLIEEVNGQFSDEKLSKLQVRIKEDPDLLDVFLPRPSNYITVTHSQMRASQSDSPLRPTLPSITQTLRANRGNDDDDDDDPIDPLPDNGRLRLAGTSPS